MIYMKPACDTWSVLARRSVERLDSTIEAVTKLLYGGRSRMAEHALQGLKSLRNELSCALDSHRRAHMTEPPTCLKTSFLSISNDTLEVIEESVLAIAQSMQILASKGWKDDAESVWDEEGVCGCYGCNASGL